MATESGTLETNGARIYYEVDGSGDPVVLIHAGVANLRMWDEQVAALAGRYRVVRYDTRGYGRTETDDVAFSNRADIAALLDHLGEDAARIVGVSRAGSIALDFTLEHPDRVTALVFVAGGIRGYDPPNEPPASVFEEPERLLEAHDWEGLAEWETQYWVDGPGQPTDRVDPALRALVHGWILDNYRAEKEEGQPQVLEPPAAGRLGEIAVPVLSVVGDLDEAGIVATCRHLAEAVPGARFELVPGTAHMLNLEQPERFNRLVLEFLAAAEAAHLLL